jgi:subtilisin family serine protease
VAVINISLYTAPSTGITDQINSAYYDYGIVIVSAAGNNYGGGVTYPAAMSVVIAVSATNIYDSLAAFSSIGSKIELAAPGDSVTTTCFNSSYCPWSGTSFAGPLVAAAAALLKEYNSSWSNDDIRHRLTTTARDLCPYGHDSRYGFGLLNIPAAMGITSTLFVDCIGGPSSIGLAEYIRVGHKSVGRDRKL